MLERPVLKLEEAVCLPTGFGYTDDGATRPKPLTRTGKFQVEYGPVGPSRRRSFLQYAAAPDAVDEVKASVALLRKVPRAWLDSHEDMFNGLARVAGRIEKAMERVERVEPKRAISSRPPIPRRVQQRIARQPAEQLAMF